MFYRSLIIYIRYLVTKYVPSFFFVSYIEMENSHVSSGTIPVDGHLILSLFILFLRKPLTQT